jgi:hypothetical protein
LIYEFHDLFIEDNVFMARGPCIRIVPHIIWGIGDEYKKELSIT